MVHRKKEEKLLDLLNAARGGDLNKTKLYYKFNSSHSCFKRFFDFAYRRGYISVDERGKYSLTSKGFDISERLENYENMVQRAEEAAVRAENEREKIKKDYGLQRL